MRLFIFSFILCVFFQVCLCYGENSTLNTEINHNKNNSREQKKQLNNDAELYRLLLSSLLGSNKLQEAEKVAHKGTLLFPDDPYWWKTYAEILIWNGKSSEAVMPLIKVFELSKDRSIAEKAFRIAIATNRYDIAKKLLNYVKASPLEQRAIYDALGDVEGLINALKKNSDRDSKYTLAQVLFAINKKEEALAVLKEMEQLYGLTTDAVLLKTNIFYSQKKFNEALKTLKDYSINVKPEEFDFWDTMSDLAWMLQELKTAKEASYILIETGKGQIKDYDRVSTVLSFEDPEKAIEISFKGWKNLNSDYLLERAFYLAYSTEKWEKIIKMASDEDTEIFKNDNVLIAYLTALQKTGKNAETLSIMDRELEKRFSKTVLSFYIYSLIDSEEFTKLKEILKKYRKYQFDSELAPPFCLAYLNLQQGQKAYQVYTKGEIKDPLLMADILSLLGKEEEARNLRFKEFNRVSEMLKQNPQLLQDPEFLREYLSSGFYFMSVSQYERVIQKAQKILSRSVLKDIQSAYFLYYERREQVVRSAKFYKDTLKPWMWLNLAIWNEDRYLMADLLKKYPDILPIKDRVTALQKTGEIQKALEYAFQGLDDNPYDSMLYKDFKDIITEYEDNFSSNISYIKRKYYSGIQMKYDLHYKLIEQGYGLGLNVNTLSRIHKDSSELAKAPFIHSEYLFFEKIFDKGFTTLYLGKIKRLDENFSARLHGKIQFLKDINMFYELGKNIEATETLYLLLGGMKDSLKIGADYNLNPRVLVHLELENSIYHSSDNKKIGEGFNSSVDIQYKLRFGYPDYTVNFYSDYGHYSERHKKGNISELSPYQDFEALPEDYLNTGIGFSFGYENKDSYVRVWRPFLRVDAGYNTIGSLSYGSSVGMGGAFLGKDNLSFEVSLNRNAGGLKETLLQIGLFYKFWF